LLRTTPEIELLEPPTNKLPPIPTPPAIVKAPVEEDKELSVDVIAKPETESIFVDGSNLNVEFADKAVPEALI
jgi:hypothetical protein